MSEASRGSYIAVMTYALLSFNGCDGIQDQGWWIARAFPPAFLLCHLISSPLEMGSPPEVLRLSSKRSVGSVCPQAGPGLCLVTIPFFPVIYLLPDRSRKFLYLCTYDRSIQCQHFTWIPAHSYVVHSMYTHLRVYSAPCVKRSMRIPLQSHFFPNVSPFASIDS